MDSQFCEHRRYDFVGPEPAVPECGHQACADDLERHKAGYAEESIWACPAGQCVLEYLKALCELDAGHEGDHEYGPRWDPAHSSSVDLGGGYPWPNGARVGATP